MRITEQQLNWLNDLLCVRLKSEESHLRDVGNFVSRKNSGLQEIIQGNAFNEDEKGNTAFYIIKSQCGVILAYFSLKCGLLFDKHGDLEIIDSKKKLSQLLSKRKLLTENEALANELKTDLEKEILIIKEKLQHLIEIEENDSVHKRVAHTYGGVEICHFCVNDNARYLWHEMGMPENSRLGVSIFWNKIVPLILQLKKTVGLEYVYLFAADTTADQTLVNYYENKMAFQQMDNVFAALPIYDFGCTLLCQKVNSLGSGQVNFYNEFNPDLNAI